MAKIKSTKLTGLKDVEKLFASCEKVVKTLGLDKYLKLKKPPKDWITNAAPDGKVTVTLSSEVKPAKGGMLKCICTADTTKQTSVMGFYNVKQEEMDTIQESLKKSGLI